MIENKNEVSKDLGKALQASEQAKQRVANKKKNGTRKGGNPFFASYVIEFLDLPSPYKENDFRKALLLKMRDFILELGKDFTFIDEEYKVQVGGEDYAIDLLFFHRGLQCLVAFELKKGCNWKQW